MPYIEDLEIRKALDEGTILPRNAGELNYCITRSFIKNRNVLNVDDIDRCINNFILAHKMANMPMKYQDWNDVLGALECAKMEGLRRGWFPAYNSSVYGQMVGVEEYNKIKYYYYNKYVAPYEDSKIKSNGDVL